ncbi:hypothetical protein [Hymenobacter wooponensis]|uniref:Uncharacterized protein n=1 Tax=Hymenobacter wooponensis TaxID=1525360 RepID=A0A4Z0MT83_9BACT|nr:hypothetical protein [Hymenobacter wooponensis]TGD82844.1 hypothetical protein EU557_03430 [Hymenobacter wooponensis]
MIRHHLPAPTPEQKATRATAYWLLVFFGCILLTILGSCKMAQPKKAKPALGLLQDKEVPLPKYGWYPSDARP